MPKIATPCVQLMVVTTTVPATGLTTLPTAQRAFISILAPSATLLKDGIPALVMPLVIPCVFSTRTVNLSVHSKKIISTDNALAKSSVDLRIPCFSFLSCLRADP